MHPFSAPDVFRGMRDGALRTNGLKWQYDKIGSMYWDHLLNNALNATEAVTGGVI